MAEYASRSSQDANAFYSLSNLGHYSALTPGMNYMYGSGAHSYQPTTTSYPTFPSSGTPFYLAPSSMSGQFSNQSGRAYTLPSQNRLSSTYHLQSSCVPSRPQEEIRSPLHDLLALETEGQESPNEDTQLSEPIIPALEGYPNVKAFDELMARYVKELSPKKQDKALIHAKRATNIRTVLLNKKTTSIESAQFRFWVKKMFTLMPNDSKIRDPSQKRICHENKPVAIREKLFKILTRAHKQCQHGGRDKTSAQVRKIYSWVPKELISRFVKLCPTCQVRRGSRVSSSPSKSEPDYMDMDTSCTTTPHRVPKAVIEH